MTRVPGVEAEEEPPELRPVFNQLRETRGRVPGMYRVLAHQPAILAAHRAYFHAALDSGVLQRPFKEKIAYKVAKMRNASYSTASHRSYALKHGVSAEELLRIDASDYSGLLPNERAALSFAEAMVTGGGETPSPLFEDLKRHYKWAEIVEIIALIGIMDLASTLGKAFELEPD